MFITDAKPSWTISLSSSPPAQTSGHTEAQFVHEGCASVSRPMREPTQGPRPYSSTARHFYEVALWEPEDRPPHAFPCLPLHLVPPSPAPQPHVQQPETWAGVEIRSSRCWSTEDGGVRSHRLPKCLQFPFPRVLHFLLYVPS